LWDVTSGREIQVLEGHSDTVKAVKFSPDGRTIASCSLDKTIRLWEVSSGLEIKVLEGHANFVGVKLSPDGRNIVLCSDKTIGLLGDLESNVQKQKSPDGLTVASCLENNTIELRSLSVKWKWKCCWQGGIQNGLVMKGSVWTGASGLTTNQKLLVDQHGGVGGVV